MAQQRKSGRSGGGQLLGDLQGKLRSVTGGGGKGGSSWLDWVWIGGAMLAGLIVMASSFTSISPGQVAVRINNITGGLTTVTQPGWITRIPFGIHSVYVLDASPQTFAMHGTSRVSDLEVRELTVRASDGSNFHFSDTTIIFQIDGLESQTVIRDGGEGRGYLKWMSPYARAILRDEFGRESTISVSDPTKFGEATERAKGRLNELLGPHGIVVTQIVTPRPQFNESYEKLIEERNKQGNELEVIKSNLAAAGTSRERRLAEVNRDQNRLIQEKRTELESELATAIAAQANAIREADTYKISKVAEGQAALSAAKQKASELRGQLEALYRGRKAEIDAFRSQPVERVMERLGERLRGVTIAIEPWANDANPSRVQIDKIGGAM